MIGLIAPDQWCKQRMNTTKVILLVVVSTLAALLAWANPELADNKPPRPDNLVRADDSIVRIHQSSRTTDGSASNKSAASCASVKAPIHHKIVEKPVIRIAEDSITLALQDKPLGWVLDQISRRSQVRIIRDQNIDTDLLSINCKNAPIDRGIRQMLSAYDIFILYGAGNNIPSAVWIYQKGQGKQHTAISAGISQKNTAAEQQIIVPNPSGRAKAIETLVRHRNSKAQDEVIQGLEDPAAMVRIRALDTAVNFDLAVPEDQLADLVQFDPSAEVRFLALTALATNVEHNPEKGSYELRTLSEYALNDSSPHVRSQAEQILGDLDSELSKDLE